MFLLSPELTVTLLCSPVEDKSLLTSVFESSFNASLMWLKAMLVTLCFLSKLHTETVPAQHNTRHKANVRQKDGR